MNLSEEFSKLDSVDLSESQRLVQKWKRKLNDAREPDILWELIDHQLATQSHPALRVLAGVKDLYSQDFFTKLNDCLHRQNTRLPALRLLAHMLSGQASWLYKIVHSPVLPTLLQLLKPTSSIIVLTSAVYVLCAIIPIAPYHITPHLPDIFECFTQLATLSARDHTKKIPRELFLGINAAIYFLFLQLYALYPCSFVQYLKGRFGPTGEIQIYHEHIAPLFNYVQLHPNLITELPSQETHKTKWRSQDPNEIATLALSLCTDPSLAPVDVLLTPLEKLQEMHLSNSDPTSASSSSSPPLLKLHLLSDSKLSGPLTTQQLSEIWSPSVVLGQVAPPTMDTRNSSRSSVHSHHSDLVSLDSTQATPILLGYSAHRQPYFNYSPTASLEPDTISVLSNEKQDTPSSSSRTHSGRSSPTKGSSTVSTPQSIREKITNVFKWKPSSSTETSDTNKIKEDFTNISLSEFDNCSNKRLAGSNLVKSYHAHVGHTPDRNEHNTAFTTSQSFPGSERSSPGNERHTRNTTHEDRDPLLPRSCPIVDRTMLLASEKLQKLSENNAQENMTHSLPTSSQNCTTFQPPIQSVDSVSTMRTLTPDNDITSSSSPFMISKTVSNDKRQSGSIAYFSPSPIVALDVYIETGRVLHSGSVSDLPLSDLEGIDWNHYGSCPHSEELTVVNNVAAMLHCQLLYERQQCKLHAKRNRQLMTKARNAVKLENEILSLHQRLHQQQQLIDCLKSENAKHETKTSLNALSEALEESKQHRKESRLLKEELQRLHKELSQLQAKNNHLTKELHNSQARVFVLEHESEQMASKLSETEKLKLEIQSLNKEHLLLEELYHKQKLTLLTLRTDNTHIQQLKDLNKTLTKEKDAALSSLKAWRRDGNKFQLHLKEKELELAQKNSQIDSLKETIHALQEKCRDKIDSLNSKYQSLRNVNQQLSLNSTITCIQ